MFTKILLPLLLAAFVTNASRTPQYSSPQPPGAGSSGGFYPSSSQRPVYTAQRAREHYTPSHSDDDDPYPSTSNLGTAQTTHGAVEPENTGFVQEPIDFSSLLKGIGSSSSKGLNIGASSSNPLFASESKNSFAGFFGTNKDPFSDFGSLATASSDRNSQSPDNEDPAGFVDPNVQFRSLFESSQAANNGFKPEDFLGNKEDSSGVEPSKGSTRSFPSFTYSGRKEDDYETSNDSPKYRSNYRQVETQDDDYSPNYRGGGGGGGRDEQSYDDDRNGYGRNYQDDSNSGPPNRSGSSGSRYNQGPQSSPPSRYSPSPAAEETSHRPQASGHRPKTAESNKSPKCKKVEKTVDYSNNEDYTSFTEPEQDYDPSTYRGRYKRQSRQSSRGNKRPMTCYVCEDEQGRYAEKCSYDSKADPNKNEYFHSSSSAYSDNGNGNGRRQSGKTDRHRRNNKRQGGGQKAEASATTSTTAVEDQDSDDKKQGNHDIEESEPKILEKRQAPGGGDRYASNFGGNGGQRRDRNGPSGNNEFEFNSAGNGDYGLPRGYQGNNGGGANEFDTSQGRPIGNNNQDRSADDNYGFGGNDNNDRGYGFDNNNNGREYNDFNFGAPADFGKESSSPGSSEGSGNRGGGRDQGINYDFSIPRDYDPDIQLSNSNNNRGSGDGSTSSSSNRDNNFDIGYDDYVKQYFPDAFGPPSSSVGPSRSSSPSFSPSSGPSISSSPPSGPSYRARSSPRDNSFNQYNPSNDRNSGPRYHHRSHSPDKQHTEPSHNFAPPPNFFNNGNPEGFENSQNLHKIMDNFSGKDRSNCQKVQKGDMSCYVCRDAKGMNKEECMYASNDPKNTRMAYHEVTEYSSDPPASILPLPRPEKFQASSSPSEGSLQHAGSEPVASSVSKTSIHPSASSSSGSVNHNSKPKPSSGSITRVESKIVSTKIHHENKSPIEYDFDY